MMQMIIELNRRNIKQWKSIQYYFKTGRDGIAQANLAAMKIMSFFGFFLTAGLMKLADVLLPLWHVSPGHFGLLLFFAVFLFFAHFQQKHRPIDYITVRATLVCYICILAALVIDISLLVYPDFSVTMIISMLLVTPILAVLEPWLIFLLQLGITTVSVLLLVLLAPPDTAALTFSCLFAFLFGILSYFITISLRANESASRAKLALRSTRDGLTHTLNKSACEQECLAYLSSGEDNGCTLLILDLDDFKIVNDSHGHITGDKVLGLFSRCLLASFRDSDIVGRVGGDEFLVLAKGLSNKALLTAKLDNFFSALDEAGRTECGLTITCSVGGIIVLGTPPGYEPMFQAADSLLYRIKRSGKRRALLMTSDEFAQSSVQRPTLLVVDDEEVHRALLSTIFEKDYNLIFASSGSKAMDILARNDTEIRLILLDMIMPDMDGREVIRRIRHNEKLRSIPIVVISADKTSELEVLELGVADMITKPFEPAIARQRVNNALTSWHPARPQPAQGQEKLS